MAQLVEQLLPPPEVRSSNPFIGTIHMEHSLSAVLKRRKERKRGREWPTLKKRRQSLIIDTQIRLINEREEKERKAKAWK